MTIYADKYAGRIADIPQKEHWIIFRQSSYYTEGDERSRTNPGHGYPASTTDYLAVEIYYTEEHFKECLANSRGESVIGVHVDKAYKVVPTVTVAETK